MAPTDGMTMEVTRHTPSRFARSIAYVVNPLVLPPLLFGVLLALHGAPGDEIAIVSAVAVLLVAAGPAVVLHRMVRSGSAESFEVLEREARAVPYAAGFAGSVAAAAALFGVVETARPLMLAVAGLLCVNTALLAVINMKWKISLHAASAAGVAAVLMFASLVSPHAGAALHEASTVVPLPSVVASAIACALLPLVMWSRIRTQSHTAGEVWGGALFGFTVPLLELWLLLSAGHL